MCKIILPFFKFTKNMMCDMCVHPLNIQLYSTVCISIYNSYNDNKTWLAGNVYDSYGLLYLFWLLIEYTVLQLVNKTQQLTYTYMNSLVDHHHHTETQDFVFHAAPHSQ